MLFTHAREYLFAKQAVVKPVLAVHTSLMEQLKHATDTGMPPLPSLCIAYTDRLHTQVSCFNRLRLVFFVVSVSFFLFLIDHFFFHFKIFRALNFRY